MALEGYQRGFDGAPLDFGQSTSESETIMAENIGFGEAAAWWPMRCDGRG